MKERRKVKRYERLKRRFEAVFGGGGTDFLYFFF